MSTRLTSQFTDDHGTTYQVDIIDTDYSLSAADITLGGDGFVLEYDGGNDDTHAPIIGSTVTLTVYEENNTHEQALNLLSTSEEGRWLLEIRKDPDGDDDLYWRGVILPEQVRRLDVAYPRPTQITAADDIGNLKHVTYSDDGTAYTGNRTIKQIILDCLNKTRTAALYGTGNFEPFVQIGAGLYAGNQTGTTVDKHRIQVSGLRNEDNNGVPQFYTAYEVLSSTAVTYNARVFYANGRWWFVPVSQYQNNPGALTALPYKKDGLATLTSNTFTTQVLEGDTFKRLAGGIQSHLAALKEVTRSTKTFADAPIIYLPDVEPADMSTANVDDDRVYIAGQKFHIAGKFKWSWPERHSGTFPSDYEDQFARFEMSVTLRLGGIGDSYINRPLTYDEDITQTSWNGFSYSYNVAEPVPIEWATGIHSAKFILENVENSLGWSIYDDLQGDLIVPFDFQTPGLDVERTGLRVTVSVRAIDHDGNDMTDALNGDGTTAPTYKFYDFGVYYAADQVPTSAGYRATSTANSRHALDQGEVLIADTISNTSLGEIKVNDGSDWVDPTGWTVVGLEASIAASGNYIHGVGVDEVLRARVKPVKIWQWSHRATAAFYLYNTIFQDGGYWLPLNLSFTARPGIYETEVWQVQRESQADTTTEADVDIVFDRPRSPDGRPPVSAVGGSNSKPFPTLGNADNDTKISLGYTNSDLADVQADVETNTTNISGLTTDLGTANSSISTNSTNITTLDTGLNNLQKKIEGENLNKLGVFTDITDDTQTGLVLATGSAKLRGGPNTQVLVTETSPGNIQLKVQAGATGSEAEVTAVTISGSTTVNTKATVNIQSGDCRFTNTPVQFNSGSTVNFLGTTSGIDYGDLDNAPTIPGDPLADADQTLGADRTINVDGNALLIKEGTTTLLKVSNTDGVQVFGDFKVDSGTVAGASLKLEEASVGGDHAVILQAPILLTADLTLTLPSADGTSGQVLVTNGSGTLSFATRVTDTNPLIKGALSIGRIIAGNTPKLYIKGEDDLAGVSLQAPESISTDVNFVLPETDGTSGQVLTTDGSGNLSFASVSGGGGGGGMTQTPFFQISGRVQWSSSYAGRRMTLGNTSYGAFNWYIHSQIVNGTAQTYSSSDAVDTTTKTMANYYIFNAGAAMPSDSKKVRVKFAGRFNNAIANGSGTVGFSVWHAASMTSGSYASADTIRLIAKSPDITPTTSSLVVWTSDFVSTTAYSGGRIMIFCEHRSGTLTSTAYCYGNWSVFLE